MYAALAAHGGCNGTGEALISNHATPSCTQDVTNIRCAAAAAVSAGGLGLTAILAAQVEPFRSWGAHLASFGAQVGQPGSYCCCCVQ